MKSHDIIFMLNIVLACICIILLFYYLYKKYVKPTKQKTSIQKPVVMSATTINNPEGFVPSQVVVSDDNGVMGALKFTDMRVPPGTIVMYAGATIPDGWSEIYRIPKANTTDTVDIRGRFPIVRSNDTASIYYDVGNTGGTENYMPPYFVVRFIRKNDY